MSARDAILARLAAANANNKAPSREQAWAALPRPYLKTGSRDRLACRALLVERLRDYDTEVTSTTPDGATQAIAEVLAKSGRKQFVVPAGLPPAWKVDGYVWRRDGGLTRDEINAADGVLTAASCAIADSGTIALHHGPSEGRRVLSLLPDWHLIVLLGSQIVEALPEYFARFQAPHLVTWISGPSATADIEMTRIKGVHGPRHLNVVLVNDEN